MSLFINKEDDFSISIYVGKHKTEKDRVLASSNEDSLKEDFGETLESIQKFTLKFKIPNYGESSSIINKCIRIGSDNGITIHPGELGKQRLFTLLKSWDFKDSKGESVIIDKDNIENLHPLVAAVIIEKLNNELLEKGLV